MSCHDCCEREAIGHGAQTAHSLCGSCSAARPEPILEDMSR